VVGTALELPISCFSIAAILGAHDEELVHALRKGFGGGLHVLVRSQPDVAGLCDDIFTVDACDGAMGRVEVEAELPITPRGARLVELDREALHDVPV
jgi:hypothetical protein